MVDFHGVRVIAIAPDNSSGRAGGRGYRPLQIHAMASGVGEEEEMGFPVAERLYLCFLVSGWLSLSAVLNGSRAMIEGFCRHSSHPGLGVVRHRRTSRRRKRRPTATHNNDTWAGDSSVSSCVCRMRGEESRHSRVAATSCVRQLPAALTRLAVCQLPFYVAGSCQQVAKASV